jgi:hypothetical protein
MKERDLREPDTALLGTAELDASEVAQHAHVVTDRGQRLIEKAAELNPAALAALGISSRRRHRSGWASAFPRQM